MIVKIQDIVTNDRRVKVDEIAGAMHISIEWVQNILATHFGYETAFCEMGAMIA